MQKPTLSKKIKSIRLNIASVDMAHHIKGQGRHQVALLPDVLDDFVTEDNPVRVIDIYVDELQLDAPGFERVKAKQTGRPGYHPATMLKLYIYGYLNRIQSSRRVPKGNTSGADRKGLFNRSLFKYDQEKIFIFVRWVASFRTDLRWLRMV